MVAEVAWQSRQAFNLYNPGGRLEGCTTNSVPLESVPTWCVEGMWTNPATNGENGQPAVYVFTDSYKLLTRPIIARVCKGHLCHLLSVVAEATYERIKPGLPPLIRADFGNRRRILWRRPGEWVGKPPASGMFMRFVDKLATTCSVPRRMGCLDRPRCWPVNGSRPGCFGMCGFA